MILQKAFINKSIILTFVCVLCIMGCSSEFAQLMRKVTYPPDFKYTNPADLRTDMAKLAQQMVMLDSALTDVYKPDENADELRRQRVINALQEMSKTVSKLKEGEAGGNHPHLQDQMYNFSAKIDQARNAASLQQPNYYYAGKVAGGCTNCHAINR